MKDSFKKVADGLRLIAEGFEEMGGLLENIQFEIEKPKKNISTSVTESPRRKPTFLDRLSIKGQEQYQALYKGWRDGTLAPDKKIPLQKDVSEYLGIAQSSVSMLIQRFHSLGIILPWERYPRN